jgi:aminoglycoside phosphotransferase (APT) family kinase protein
MSTARIAEITAAYEAERASHPGKVTRADQLPLAYEDITPEWLTAVLAGNAPGAQVTALSLGPEDHGSSSRRKIAVTWNQAGQDAGLPARLFCKSTSELPNRIVLGVSGGAFCETVFLRHIRPHYDIEAPVCHFAGYDAETINSIIIMTDLSDEVMSFCDHHTPMPRARAESQMRLLARLHGQGYGNGKIREAMRPLPTWPQFFKNIEGFGSETIAKNGFLAAEEVIPARLFARFEQYWPLALQSVAMHDDLPQTVAHGDVHLKNWYIAGDGEMGLSDWQCVTRAHWSRDVCYAIGSALSTEDRRAWEKDLLALYLEEMAREGGPRVQFDEAWLHYRQQLVTALVWWTLTLTPGDDLPDMQPRDITLEMIRRLAVSADDCNAFGAFG